MGTADKKSAGIGKGTPGPGRKKGSLNKENKALREMILQALNEQPGGGVAYLKIQAVENPGPFMSLLGKVLPTTLAGDPDAPLLLQEITRKIIKA